MKKLVVILLSLVPCIASAEDRVVDGKKVDDVCLFGRRRYQIALAEQANHTLMHMYAEQRVQTELLRQLAGNAQRMSERPWTFPRDPSQVPPDWQYRQQFPTQPQQVPPDQQFRQQMPTQPQQVQPAPDYRQQLPQNPGSIAPDPNFRLSLNWRR